MKEHLFVFIPMEESSTRFIPLLDAIYKSYTNLSIVIPVFGKNLLRVEALFNKLKNTEITVIPISEIFSKSKGWNILGDFVNEVLNDDKTVILSTLNIAFCLKNIISELKDVDLKESFLSINIFEDIEDNPINLESKRLITDIVKRTINLEKIVKEKKADLGQVLISTAGLFRKSLVRLLGDYNEGKQKLTASNYIQKLRKYMIEDGISEAISENYGLFIPKISSNVSTRIKKSKIDEKNDEKKLRHVKTEDGEELFYVEMDDNNSEQVLIASPDIIDEVIENVEETPEIGETFQEENVEDDIVGNIDKSDDFDIIINSGTPLIKRLMVG